MKYIQAILLFAFAYPASCIAQHDAEMKALAKTVAELVKQNETFSSDLKKLMTEGEKRNETEYKSIKKNFLCSHALLKATHSRITAINSLSNKDNVKIYIGDLENPTSNKLGINLEKVILDEAAKLNIGRIDTPKLLESLSAIIKSPIVESIPNIGPAISIVNSAVSMVRGIAFSQKIDSKKLAAFENEVNKYFEYYKALNDGRAGYKYDTMVQVEENNVLHKKIKDVVVSTAIAFGYNVPIMGERESTAAYLNKFFLSFNSESIEDKLQEIEAANTKNGSVDYAAILRSDSHPLIISSSHIKRAVPLADAVELRLQSYKDVNEVYAKRIIAALQVAQKNNISGKNVADMITTFEGLQATAVEGIDDSINLQEFLEVKKTVKALSDPF